MLWISRCDNEALKVRVIFFIVISLNFKIILLTNKNVIINQRVGLYLFGFLISIFIANFLNMLPGFYLNLVMLKTVIISRHIPKASCLFIIRRVEKEYLSIWWTITNILTLQSEDITTDWVKSKKTNDSRNGPH